MTRFFRAAINAVSLRNMNYWPDWALLLVIKLSGAIMGAACVWQLWNLFRYLQHHIVVVTWTP